MNTTKIYKSFLPSILEQDPLFDSFFKSINDNILDRSYRIEKLDSGWLLKMALPGVTKNEVEISTEEDKLIINVDSANGWIKKSRKTFIMPSSVDSDSIFAEMKDGILLMSLSTKKEQKNKIVKIN